MDGLKVAELAERAGLAPSTVRFYERAGLLSPAQRAPNGYRLFAESALDELAFITRAKSIGMSLDDIADLDLTADEAALGPVPWGSTLPNSARGPVKLPSTGPLP